MTDGFEIPGDLGWIALVVALLAVAWRTGVLRESSARRGVVAGAGVALLGVPLMVLLTKTYSLPNAVWVAAFYGSVVTVTLLVWFRDRVRTVVPA